MKGLNVSPTMNTIHITNKDTNTISCTKQYQLLLVMPGFISFFICDAIQLPIGVAIITPNIRYNIFASISNIETVYGKGKAFFS